MHSYYVGFSIGWAEKIGKCAVYDFDQKKIDKFEKKIVTTEEPDLKKYLVKNKKKIKFIKSSQSIKDYKNIFLTLDTPLNLNGKPNVSYIFQTLIRLKKYLRKNANLIICIIKYPIIRSTIAIVTNPNSSPITDNIKSDS